MKKRIPLRQILRYPAGTKLYRKTLKSQFGHRGYKAHFDVKPINVITGARV